MCRVMNFSYTRSQIKRCSAKVIQIQIEKLYLASQGADEGLRVRSHLVEVLDVERKRVPLVRIYLKYI